ncbi:hypothetical protein U732_1189 [Clostridium argentinense CDC 2741]|uniref:DUF4321 domain-containing protein n=1 Tax=Clostridium argentinense CDC 2741 TaxID=1418104 RepID=A0A0C1UJ83_9CLOT|nr:DUF4321 domain-containing protein [Clostridium argentinense]ARC85583.1 hypothetical protein RSJ17_14250 [Clostridium argentinense]KIE47335.1 hypothetical protein U732_1189 [Clostridium argentinense CDC 2741]NFF40098.1 DUF4321 domain-containing protein [Clostridium argentinense]NFP50202.1 DUF4321 domain-containing protein [Clostridium argentinense]NFP74843.1 DUF4321 domain-containing protein [Clostridium argentinense]
MKNSERKTREYIFVILLAAISGSFIGEVLSKSVSFLDILGRSYSIGLSDPFLLDLKVIGITFGIYFNINLMSIICVILAIILFRKY